MSGINARNREAELQERVRKLEIFASGAQFTMRKVLKHNKLTEHDSEMLRQQIEFCKSILVN